MSLLFISSVNHFQTSYVSVRHKRVMMPPWVYQINWELLLGSLSSVSQAFTPWLYVSGRSTCTQANGLIVDYVRSNVHRRLVGRVDRWGDVLVSLPQENWLCEASPSCWNLCRAYVYTQNWFRSHDLNGLQCQYRFADKASSSLTYFDRWRKTNLNSLLAFAMAISVRIFCCNLSF